MNGKAGVFSEDGGLISHRRCRLNTGFASGGFSASYDSFVAGSSAVLRLNFCAKNPPLRQAAKRYRQP